MDDDLIGLENNNDTIIEQSRGSFPKFGSLILTTLIKIIYMRNLSIYIFK